MSTRQSCYHREADEDFPRIHIYNEMLMEGPTALRMEIEMEHCTVNIPVPPEFKAVRERMVNRGE